MEHPILVQIIKDLYKFRWRKQTIWWSVHIGSIFSWSKSIHNRIKQACWVYSIIDIWRFFSTRHRGDLSVDRLFYKVYIISNNNKLYKGLICFYVVEHSILVYRRYISRDVQGFKITIISWSDIIGFRYMHRPCPPSTPRLFINITIRVVVVITYIEES